MDVSDASGFGDPVEHAGDLVPIEGPVVPDDQPVDVITTTGPVSVEEFYQLGMEWEVAVVVEFPDRDPEPVPGPWGC